MSSFKLITAASLPSPARSKPTQRAPLRIGAVQTSWHGDAAAHRGALADGIRLAAANGARIVCLQELTLSPYFATHPDRFREASAFAESIPDGPTTTFAREIARATGVAVHASLYEGNEDGLGYNTAIC